MTEETNPILNLSPENPTEPQSLIARVRQWLTSPVFPEDEDKTRRASMANSLLIAALAFGSLYALTIPWNTPTILPSWQSLPWY